VKLPIDCDARYYPGFLSPEESAVLYQAIWNACDLSPAKIVAPGGSEFVPSFGKCMFVDDELVNSTRFPPAHGSRRPWIDELLALKQRIEDLTGKVYGVCVCIYYKDGECGADYHSDLTAFGDVSSIASVSLGAERAFMFRRIDNHDDTYRLDLGEGSLVIMGARCQELYEHALPVDPDCRQPRINLTFRMFGWK
jgi:alkylated DNA repair dioxygenase AlkB